MHAIQIAQSSRPDGSELLLRLLKVFLKTRNDFTYEILELRGGDAD